MEITARNGPFLICYYLGTNPTGFQFGITEELEVHMPMLKFFMALVCIMSIDGTRYTFVFFTENKCGLINCLRYIYKWLTSLDILVFRREGSTDRKRQWWQYTHVMLLYVVTEILAFFTCQIIHHFCRRFPCRGTVHYTRKGLLVLCAAFFCFFNTWFCTYLTVLFCCLETGLFFLRSA